MKRDDFQHKYLYQAGVGALLLGGVALCFNCNAATAVGTANATVVESVSVSVVSESPVVVAPVTVAPVLSGTVFTVESYATSQSLSAPLLRPVAPPPTVAAVAGTGAVAAPAVANSATVNVTRKADGSLGVSGGANLTFAVSQSVNGALNIEYN